MPGQTPVPRFQLHQAGHLQAFLGSARHGQASRPCPGAPHPLRPAAPAAALSRCHSTHMVAGSQGPMPCNEQRACTKACTAGLLFGGVQCIMSQRSQEERTAVGLGWPDRAAARCVRRASARRSSRSAQGSQWASRCCPGPPWPSPPAAPVHRDRIGTTCCCTGLADPLGAQQAP